MIKEFVSGSFECDNQSMDLSNARRWWTYQKERFPLAQFLPMMAMLGFCSLSYSLHLDKPDAAITDITIAQYIVAILTTLFWFMLLRISDEHKDFEEDANYRPYRPVQRGLVTLRELRIVGIILVAAQLLLTVWIDAKLLLLLLAVYVWFLLMTNEFFVPKWLKSHPVIYLASHMMILPLINLYTTSIEWLPRGGGLSFGLVLFMVSTFWGGTVIEIGRKLRAPQNEEHGVETYTALWGSERHRLSGYSASLVL